MRASPASHRQRATGLVLVVAVLVCLLPLPAFAQRVQSNVVLVRADDVVSEDLYAAGNTIIVSGRVTGDLVAVAFDSIVINGVVEGDVVAFSNRVEITGRVGGSVRVAATSVVVEGEVENDLFAGAFTVQVAAGSSIGRDALVWSRTAELLGDIGRDFEGTQSRTRLAGTVGGNVDITTAGLTLLPGLDVTGDLRYIADDEATVAQTIAVGGTFIRAEALSPNVRVRGIRLLAQLVAVLAGLGVGLGLLWAVPRRSLAASRALSRRPFLSLAWGVGVASVPVALLIVTVGIVSLTSLSSSGPVVLVLIPVAVALGALVVLGLLTAPVPVGVAVGTLLRPSWSAYARYVIGFPAIVIAWLVPWIGAILLAVLALAGLGAWLVAGDE